MTFLAIFFAAISLILSACTPKSPPLIPITIQLGAAHQALYGGFYAADQNGDYVREGLTVNFIEGGAGIDLVDAVLNGTAQFGMMGASGLISARAEGYPIRALATISRRDPVIFFSLANSNIIHLEDFVGKRIYVSPRLTSRLYAMLAHAGISSDEMTITTSGNFTDLYTGEIDVASGSVINTLLTVQRDGYEVNIIYPDDYGVHFYSSTIFATDDYIAANPEQVTRFLRATLQGWSYSVENPQSVGQLVLQYNPNADRDFESASMVASLPYINTGEDHIGWMKLEIWEGMLDTMREQGEVTTQLDASDLYTMEFIQQIYGETQP